MSERVTIGDHEVATYVDRVDPADEQQRQRLAALILTLPGWNRNYTATTDAAGWLIREAEKVGWRLTISDTLARPPLHFRQMDDAGKPLPCTVPGCTDH